MLTPWPRIVLCRHFLDFRHRPAGLPPAQWAPWTRPLLHLGEAFHPHGQQHLLLSAAAPWVDRWELGRVRPRWRARRRKAPKYTLATWLGRPAGRVCSPPAPSAVESHVIPQRVGRILTATLRAGFADLKDHFRAAGEVVHADVLMSADGRSRGCGLVTFSTVREAENAIQTLHDSMLHSRAIFVREDREPSGNGAGFGEGGKAHGKGGGKGYGKGEGGGSGCQVFVGNLPWEVTWQSAQCLPSRRALSAGMLRAAFVRAPRAHA